MMSAECERVFSSAKHLVTDSCNRLTIEANECPRHWFGKPEEEEDLEADDSCTYQAATTKKENESDVEDSIEYELDSDGEIVI